MKDLTYDINIRDVVFKNGDFVLTENPSVQNGGILMLARGTNYRRLQFGIGINQLRGGTVSQANYELNRWKQQVTDDGGRGTVKTINDGAGNVDFEWNCNYL